MIALDLRDTLIPSLRTARLLLRPFELSDASRVQTLAGQKEIAARTLTIPHPYEDGMAEEWIQSHAEAWKEGHLLPLAVTSAREGLVGAIGLHLTPQHSRAELGYWIGLPYWNRGYATEAATAIVSYGFGEVKLQRICARHFRSNPASGRVLAKLGMLHEGTLRQHVIRFGQPEDLECYAVLRSDWRAEPSASAV